MTPFPTISHVRRGVSVLSAEVVLQRVAKHYGLPVQRLREKKGRGLEPRNVALWLIWEKCGLSQREVGELFGGMNYAAVAQRLRRLKPESRQVAEKLIKQMSNV
jgi:chromosomal replication initiation ATPase DnaA